MDTTRRYPRTLNEAFGLYATGPIHEPEEQRTGYPFAWWFIVAACGIAGLVITFTTPIAP